MQKVLMLLECGCKPTNKKLADPLLAESIAFWVAMEGLAHSFCLLVQLTLKKALLISKDYKENKYALPDFDSMLDLANPEICEVLHNILAILGDA
jgi:hypothetical protein